MIIEDLGRTMPRINAALQNRQTEYQNSMVEVEGIINKTPITILIDPGASLSYISPNLSLASSGALALELLTQKPSYNNVHNYKILQGIGERYYKYSYHIEGDNCWRISEDYAQNQCSLGESTSRISNFHGGSRRYDKRNPYNYFN